MSFISFLDFCLLFAGVDRFLLYVAGGVLFLFRFFVYVFLLVTLACFFPLVSMYPSNFCFFRHRFCCC